MIITLCGSLSFKQQMLIAGKQLEAVGHTILYPAGISDPTLTTSASSAQELRLKHDLIARHFRKIEQSEAILIINCDKNGIRNYIGGNTLMEIGFAHVLRKKIFLLNPIPDIEFYKSEIEAVTPIIINNDISKVA